MSDYLFELKDIDTIKRLGTYGFEYSILYEGYVRYYDTGVSVIRFIVFADEKRKGKLYVDSSIIYDTFSKERISKLLKTLNIEHLFKEVLCDENI